MSPPSKAACLALCASLAGCANQPGKSAAIGAGIGAVVGGVAGGLIGGNAAGALAGTAAGAAVGSLFGWGTAKLLEYDSTQVRSESDDRQVYGFAERVSSPLIKVRKVSNTPSQVRPGETVRIGTHYSLMLPQGMAAADVDENWTLRKDGNLLAEMPSQPVKRSGGGWKANASIAIPGNAAPGTYVIEHRVKTGTSYDMDESNFVVVSD